MPNPWRHKSLNAVLVTGAGSPVSCGGRNNISWQYKLGGTVAATAVSVQLEGRVYPGGDWVPFADNIMTDVNGAIVPSAFPTSLSEVRLNLTVMTGGTSPSVTGWIILS